MLLSVRPGVTSGTVGVRFEIVCGSTTLFVPGELTPLVMPFTSSWADVLPPYTCAAPPPPSGRRLSGIVTPPMGTKHGDINGDDRTNAKDVQDLLTENSYPGTLNIAAYTPNQKLWLNANRDNLYGNAGDCLYAERMYLGGTPYPVFEDSECPAGAMEDLDGNVYSDAAPPGCKPLGCPTGASDDLTLSVALYAADQSPTEMPVEVAVEMKYSGSVSAWTVTSGSPLPPSSPPPGHHYFLMALGSSTGTRKLSIQPDGGWQPDSTISLAFVAASDDARGPRGLQRRRAPQREAERVRERRERRHGRRRGPEERAAPAQQARERRGRDPRRRSGEHVEDVEAELPGPEIAVLGC